MRSQSAPAGSSVSERTSTHSAELGLLLVVVLWGVNFTFIKLGISDIPPFAFAGIRFTLAGLVLLALLRWHEGSIAWPPGTVQPILVLGLLGNTLYQALFMYGLARTSVANASLIVAAAPILVVVFGATTGVERVTAPVAAGVLLATSGVLLVLAVRGPTFGRATLIGDLTILLATFCWAAFTLLLRKYRPPISDLRLTALTLVTGAPGLVLLGLPGMLRTDWTAVRAAAWFGLAGSSLLAIVIAYMLWNRAVRVLGSSRTSIFSAAVPLIAMLFAWPLLGEVPRPTQFAGAGLIIGGVFLSRWKPGGVSERFTDGRSQAAGH